ncbi:MAG: FHA domain-containing protein [Clostridia bacterium]|nr:FHA domain-containing protein [Clostridia bacterium]
MRKIRWLATALLMVFMLGLGSSALAVEEITISLATVRDSGLLEVIASSGYTEEADMNFTAYTENGDLEVRNAFALRNAGTSWFVILEYGSDNRNDNTKKVSDNLMAGIADLVLDIDEGALIPATDDAAVNVQKAQQLRDVLKGKHGQTDIHKVPDTLSKVMNYIRDHRADLMPNIAVVLITQARLLTEDEMNTMQDTLTQYRNVTTHVLCPLAPGANNNWTSRAYRVSQMGAGTLSGSGQILNDYSLNTSTQAVERIRDLERAMLMLLLEPKTLRPENVGKELTIKQTTAGGKELTATGRLSEEAYALWKERIAAAGEQQKEEGGEDSGIEDDTTVSTSLFNTSSGYTWMYVAPEVEQPESNTGLSTELLVGIILGVVILALAVVLILVKKGKKKKNKTATTVYGAPAAGSGGSSGGGSAGGLTVTLRGDDGSTHTGKMKNNRLMIGRDSSRGAMLAIPSDGKLSGTHVLLEKQGNLLLATDQQSRNGTKVNGNRISGPTVLNQNDTLGIGSHTYTVTWR